MSNNNWKEEFKKEFGHPNKMTTTFEVIDWIESNLLKEERYKQLYDEVIRTSGNAQDRLFGEIERLKKYVSHSPSCYKMQDWSEALEALSLCPDGWDKVQAENEVMSKMNTCTCGLDGLLKEASLPIEQEFEALANELAEWSEQTFGKRPASAPVYHLKKEVNELIDALEKDPTNWRAIKTELADCFLLVVDASKKHGLTAAGIISNARGKFEVAKRRSWGKPDENGVVEHIRSEEENNISQLQEVSPDSSEGGSVVHFLLGKNKPFGIDTVRRILNQFDKGEISMSKIVEELNITAYRWLQEETFELNVRLNAAINLNKAEVLKSIKENPSFTMQDFEKGLMLAGLVKPANEQEQKEFELLNQGSTDERSVAREDAQGDGDGNKINSKQK